VGHMDASALRAIYGEHVLSADAQTPFTPPNNPTLQCTPEGELSFVVGTDGIDTETGELKPDARPAHYAGCMVEGRNDKPISELMEAEEARRAGLRVAEVVALRLYSGNILARDGGVLTCCACPDLAEILCCCCRRALPPARRKVF